MAFVRKKVQGNQVYYALVENIRDEAGKTRQRYLRYLGKNRPRGRQKGLHGTVAKTIIYKREG